MAHQSLLPDRPWLAHYDPGVPADLDVPPVPLPTLLTEAAGKCGNRDALIFYGNRISFLKFDQAASRFARGLMRLGVKPGDRVSICLPNTPQFPIAFYGTLRAGAVAVPTNPLYTAHEMRHQLQDSGAKVIVILDSLYPTLHEIRDEVPVEHIVLTSIAEYLPFPLSVLYPIQQSREQHGKPQIDMNEVRSDPKVAAYAQLLERDPSLRGGYELIDLPPPASPDDLAILQYTGGTTGLAKGAMLTHRNLVANAMQAALWTGMPRFEQHTTLAVAPFFHVYGLTVGLNLSVYSGWSMVLLPRFIPKDVLKAIEKYKTDSFPGIPTMYSAITREIEKRHKGDISAVRICLSGAAPLLAEVQSRFEKLSGGSLVEGYGLTEASPVTHSNPLWGDRRIGTIGLPMPGTDARIIDPTTWETMPVGERGEIAIRGPQVMRGYWNRPDETALVLRDGWLRTGDIGIMDADGYFSVVDRAKDLIIAGGYNIYPREVEEVLVRHPAVQEAVAIGVPDPYRGETVRAYIVLRDGQHVTAEELTNFAKSELAIYKVPKQFVFRRSCQKHSSAKCCVVHCARKHWPRSPANKSNRLVPRNRPAQVVTACRWQPVRMPTV